MSKKTSTKTQTKDLPLVAVDFGSYGLVAMAAEYVEENGDKVLKILGVEQSQRFNCVKNGLITNTSDASYMLRELLFKLGNRIGYGDVLPTAFVSFGGMTMQSAFVTAKRFGGSPFSLIQSIEQECSDKIARQFSDKNLIAHALTPYQYILDDRIINGLPTKDDKGMNVVAQYLAFIGHKNIWEKIKETFDRTGISIEQKWVRPEAHVCALVGDEDERRGVAIIDMGDQTTTLTIYKGGRYITSHTIPLGGRSITRDIEQIGMTFAIAQKLKHKFGYAHESQVQKDNVFRIPSVQDPEHPIILKQTELAMMINSRLYEICQSIFKIIDQHKDDVETIYLTGGASMLKGLVPYLQSKTSIHVEYGSHAEWLSVDTEDEYYQPKYSALVGTLALGAMRRENEPDAEPIKKSLMKKLQETVYTLFD